MSCGGTLCTQWGGANGDGGASGGGAAPSGKRPRLKLTKRSEAGVRAAQAKSGGAKSNPFGDAKPREEVLYARVHARRDQTQAEAWEQLEREMKELEAEEAAMAAAEAAAESAAEAAAVQQGDGADSHGPTLLVGGGCGDGGVGGGVVDDAPLNSGVGEFRLF